MLQLKNVEARYGSFKALEQVSMSVAQGELVVLLGANGAGKSTLFNTISGLIKPSAGTITLDGTDVTGLKPSGLVQNGVVQCPEGRKLFPEMSVLKNLMLGAYVHRRNKAAIKKTLEDVLTLFPILDEKKDQSAGSLSGGQQQMVAIGRAMMGRPKLLMLDEPSLGLAPLVVKQIFETVRQINAEGTTILLAEQNMHFCLGIATHATVVDKGQIVYRDTIEGLRANDAIKQRYLAI